MKLRLLFNQKLTSTFIILCITCILSMPIYANNAPLHQIDQVTIGLSMTGPTVIIVADNRSSNFKVPAPTFTDINSNTRPAGVLPAKLVVNYNPPTCLGSVSTWSTSAQTAFNFAANIWAELIESNQTIAIDACWRSDLSADILGSARSTELYRDFTNAPVANTWYPVALANTLANSDLNGNNVAEIEANFNSNFSNWYFGIDGKTPSTDFDFAMLALHELAHGLGFFGQMTVTESQGEWGSFPAIYDRFAEDGESVALLKYLSSLSLANALTGNVDGVFFNGPNANMANSGNRVKLYTPNVWLQGSSYVHLDEIFNQTSHALMTFSQARGESIHDPGVVTVCMLKDIGWNASCLSSNVFSVNDRYDVIKDKALYVALPGVLANDINANGNPRVYNLAQDDKGIHITEQAWYDYRWHERDITAAAIPAAAPAPELGALASLSVNGEPRVYYKSRWIDTTRVIELAWYDQDKVWKWRDLTTEAISSVPHQAMDLASPVVATTVNSNPLVYYLGTDGHVYELAWVGDHWSRRDVTSDTNAPAAAPGVLAVTTITHDDPRVYYLDAQGHVHELAWRTLNQVWYHRDLMANPDRTPAAGRALAATTANLEPRIYYLGADQHMYEFAWFSYEWHWRDVTADMRKAGINVPNAIADSPLRVTTVGSRGDPRVYFLSEGQKGRHLQELAWFNDQWNYTDLTGKLPNARGVDQSPFAVVMVKLDPLVYYFGTDQHLHELAWRSDQWADTTIGAPPPSLLGPLSATTAQEALLSARLVSNVAHGNLALYEDGSFVYVPNQGFPAGYVEHDSFTYVATIGSAESVTMTVELAVTDECFPVDNNALVNFCFAEGREPWKFWDNGSEGAYEISTDNPFAGTTSAVVTVRAPGSNIQFYQAGLALQPKTSYELSFAAYAEDGRDMDVWVHRHGPDSPYTNYGLCARHVNLEPYWKYFTLTFTTSDLPDMTDARLRFWLAPYAEASTVYHLDRVVLRPSGEPPTAPDPCLWDPAVEGGNRGLLAGTAVGDISQMEQQNHLYLPLVAEE